MRGVLVLHIEVVDGPVIFFEGQDLDRIIVEGVYPWEVFLHHDHSFEGAVVYHHMDRDVDVVGEEHCDPNFLDHQEVLILIEEEVRSC